MKERTLKGNTCSKEIAYQIIREWSLRQTGVSFRTQINEDSFNNPNWAYLQAYQAGYQKAHAELNSFLPTPGEK